MARACARPDAPAIPLARLFPDQAGDFTDALSDQRFIAPALDVQAQQGFSIRTTQTEAPVGKLDADPIGAVDAGVVWQVERQNLLDGALHIGHFVVDLATARECRNTLVYQLGQALAGVAHQRGDQQPRNVAAVAVGKIAEVVVRAHFTAVHRVFGAHALFDEGVAGLALNGLAAGGGDLLDGVPGQPWVVDDLATGVLG
ncbi:hypothetical protein D3C79_751180 [compost metagenome]